VSPAAWHRLRRHPTERGGATVLAIGLVGVLATVAVLVGALGGAVADQRRAESAADLAALAAAGAAQAGGDPCGSARASAGRNGARLVACAVAGEVVTVRVQRRTHPVLGRRFTLIGRSRAGPVQR
jgi:secretion/DNA translocation related TadE-like protein